MEDTLIPKETYVGLNGKEYKIYPMVLKNYAKVERLFSKIDDQCLYFDMPEPMVDKHGKLIKKPDGSTKYNYDKFNALCELFELALHVSRDEFLEVLDLDTGVFVLDAFRGLSGLKKKMETAMAQEALTALLPALSKTPVKPEKP